MIYRAYLFNKTKQILAVETENPSDLTEIVQVATKLQDHDLSYEDIINALSNRKDALHISGRFFRQVLYTWKFTYDDN